MTLLCGQSSNLIYMVSLLDFSNSISEMDKFKMFALEQLAKKRPFVPGGGSSDQSQPFGYGPEQIKQSEWSETMTLSINSMRCYIHAQAVISLAAAGQPVVIQ